MFAARDWRRPPGLGASGFALRVVSEDTASGVGHNA